MTRPISSAEAVFLALADLNSDEREAFLREHCGHDPQLRAEVDAMLQAANVSGRANGSALCEWPPHWVAGAR